MILQNIRKHDPARGHHTPEDMKPMSAPVMLLVAEFPQLIITWHRSPLPVRPPAWTVCRLRPSRLTPAPAT